ncbi:hypothetical protein [Actinomadura rayongensis]|uniref:C2H2-type domain-containing protein n=1 Tax=Actinomadura rayongensis TaxID=1429076 RepID=A0A6I4W7J4_9ACTN|nr:hypothetical protein [Actinomadura rayongensis]MXQ65263.1 hypothetical protein [Actinomadura rayongensis]
MHIPAYARRELLDAMPSEPSEEQARGSNCFLCDTPFAVARERPIEVVSGENGSLHACRGCLTAFVAKVRRQRHAAAEHAAHEENSKTPPLLTRYLTSIDNVRRAGEAVQHLAENGELEPPQLAWLMVSLESAHDWAAEERSDIADTQATKQAELDLFIQMVQVRSLAANILIYHVINEASPAEPELCAEMECPPECQGRHDAEHIDCGPDSIYEELAEQHGVLIRDMDKIRYANSKQEPS